ncbi:MAG: helix-turn-helix domain-containing protein [Muribaculaceae bacterium]|nr:helix-turn-helix domain-containing protein [Muribaculaceae bacterium]
MDISQTIKLRRAKLGISQQDLSEFSGVAISTIKDLERGVGNPSIATLQKLLEALGLEVIIQVKQTIK